MPRALASRDSESVSGKAASQDSESPQHHGASSDPHRHLDPGHGRLHAGFAPQAFAPESSGISRAQMRQTYLAQTGATTATNTAPDAGASSTLDPIMKRKVRAHHVDINARLTSFTDRYRLDPAASGLGDSDEACINLSGGSNDISDVSAPLLRESTQRAPR